MRRLCLKTKSFLLPLWIGTYPHKLYIILDNSLIGEHTYNYENTRY